MEWHEIEVDSASSVKFVQNFQPSKTLNDGSRISENDGIPKMGGVIRKGIWAWLAYYSELFVVSLSDGETIANFNFNEYWGFSNCFIKCVEEINLKNECLTLLAVVLEYKNSLGGDVHNTIVIYSLGTGLILSRLNLAKWKINCLTYMNANKCHGTILQYFEGCLAIGCQEGVVILLDLKLNKLLHKVKDKTIPENGIELECEIVSHELSVLSLHHSFRNCQNESVSFGLILKETEVASSVTCILPINITLGLAIGLENGQLLLYDLVEMQPIHISMISSKQNESSLIKLNYMEPIHDSKPRLYIYGLYKHKNRLVVKFYDVLYTEQLMDEFHLHNRYHFENFISCTQCLEIELESYNAKFTGCKTSRRIEALNEDYRYCLCSISWYSYYERKNKMVVFDLNQWYREQTPEILHLKNNPSCLAGFTYSYSDAALQIYLKPDCIGNFSSIQRYEEHLYPNSRILNFLLLLPVKTCSLQWFGVQNRLISKLCACDQTVFLQPEGLFEEIVNVHLTPADLENVSGLSKDEKCETLLTVALEQNCFGLLRKCGKNLAFGSFIGTFSSFPGLTLTKLTDWIWKRAAKSKKRCNEICSCVFKSGNYSMNIHERRELGCIIRQMKMLIKLLEVIIANAKSNIVPRKLFKNITSNCDSLRMMTEYQDIVFWLINIGLLPEDLKISNQTTTIYPYAKLKEYYVNKRNDFAKMNEKFICQKTGSCKYLFIDMFIDKDCGGDQLHEIWVEQNEDGLYPPANIESMLRVLLLPEVKYDDKCAILLYFFLDLNMTIDANAHEHIVDNFIKFPSIFKLSNGLVKTIQSFWNLDQGKFESAVDEFNTPFNRGQEIPHWMVELLIEAISLQGASNLSMCVLEARSGSVSPLLKLKTLMLSGLIAEAFHYARNHHTSELSEFFFKCLLTAGKFSIISNLTLNDKEDKIIQKLLKTQNTPNSETLLLVYLLQKSKYLEAIVYMDDLSKTKCGTDTKYNRRGAHFDTPNMILTAFNTTMTPVAQRLTDAYLRIKDNFNIREYSNKTPIPFSAKLRKQNHKTTGDIFISAALSAHFISNYSEDELETMEIESESDFIMNSKNIPFLRDPIGKINLKDKLRKIPPLSIPVPYKPLKKRKSGNYEFDEISDSSSENANEQQNSKKRQRLMLNSKSNSKNPRRNNIYKKMEIKSSKKIERNEIVTHLLNDYLNQSSNIARKDANAFRGPLNSIQKKNCSKPRESPAMQLRFNLLSTIASNNNFIEKTPSVLQDETNTKSKENDEQLHKRKIARTISQESSSSTNSEPFQNNKYLFSSTKAKKLDFVKTETVKNNTPVGPVPRGMLKTYKVQQQQQEEQKQISIESVVHDHANFSNYATTFIKEQPAETVKETVMAANTKKKKTPSKILPFHVKKEKTTQSKKNVSMHITRKRESINYDDQFTFSIIGDNKERTKEEQKPTLAHITPTLDSSIFESENTEVVSSEFGTLASTTTSASTLFSKNLIRASSATTGSHIEFFPILSSSKVCESKSKFLNEEIKPIEKISERSTGIISNITTLQQLDNNKETNCTNSQCITTTSTAKNKKMLDTTLGMSSFYDFDVSDISSVLQQQQQQQQQQQEQQKRKSDNMYSEISTKLYNFQSQFDDDDDNKYDKDSLISYDRDIISLTYDKRSDIKKCTKKDSDEDKNDEIDNVKENYKEFNVDKNEDVKDDDKNRKDNDDNDEEDNDDNDEEDNEGDDDDDKGEENSNDNADDNNVAILLKNAYRTPLLVLMNTKKDDVICISSDSSSITNESKNETKSGHNESDENEDTKSSKETNENEKSFNSSNLNIAAVKSHQTVDTEESKLEENEEETEEEEDYIIDVDEEEDYIIDVDEEEDYDLQKNEFNIKDDDDERDNKMVELNSDNNDGYNINGNLDENHTYDAADKTANKMNEIDNYKLKKIKWCMDFENARKARYKKQMVNEVEKYDKTPKRNQGVDEKHRKNSIEDHNENVKESMPYQKKKQRNIKKVVESKDDGNEETIIEDVLFNISPSGNIEPKYNRSVMKQDEIEQLDEKNDEFESQEEIEENKVNKKETSDENKDENRHNENNNKRGKTEKEKENQRKHQKKEEKENNEKLQEQKEKLKKNNGKQQQQKIMVTSNSSATYKHEKSAYVSNITLEVNDSSLEEGSSVSKTSENIIFEVNDDDSSDSCQVLKDNSDVILKPAYPKTSKKSKKSDDNKESEHKQEIPAEQIIITDESSGSCEALEDNTLVVFNNSSLLIESKVQTDQMNKNELNIVKNTEENVKKRFKISEDNTIQNKLLTKKSETCKLLENEIKLDVEVHESSLTNETLDNKMEDSYENITSNLKYNINKNKNFETFSETPKVDEILTANDENKSIIENILDKTSSENAIIMQAQYAHEYLVPSEEIPMGIPRKTSAENEIVNKTECVNKDLEQSTKLSQNIPVESETALKDKSVSEDLEKIRESEKIVKSFSTNILTDTDIINETESVNKDFEKLIKITQNAPGKTSSVSETVMVSENAPKMSKESKGSVESIQSKTTAAIEGIMKAVNVHDSIVSKDTMSPETSDKSFIEKTVENLDDILSKNETFQKKSKTEIKTEYFIKRKNNAFFKENVSQSSIRNARSISVPPQTVTSEIQKLNDAEKYNISPKMRNTCGESMALETTIKITTEIEKFIGFEKFETIRKTRSKCNIAMLHESTTKSSTNNFVASEIPRKSRNERGVSVPPESTASESLIGFCGNSDNQRITKNTRGTSEPPVLKSLFDSPSMRTRSRVRLNSNLMEKKSKKRFNSETSFSSEGNELDSLLPSTSKNIKKLKIKLRKITPDSDSSEINVETTISKNLRNSKKTKNRTKSLQAISTITQEFSHIERAKTPDIEVDNEDSSTAMMTTRRTTRLRSKELEGDDETGEILIKKRLRKKGLETLTAIPENETDSENSVALKTSDHPKRRGRPPNKPKHPKIIE